MNTIPKTKKHGGFTLVETMAVIVILALLAAAAIFGVSSYMDRANVSKTVADLSSYDYAIQTMMMENAGVVSGSVAYGIDNTDDDYTAEGTAGGSMSIVNLMKDSFASDLQVEGVDAYGENCEWTDTTDNNNKIVMLDPWGNNYIMEIDCGGENTEDTGFTTECFVYIYSMGGDALTDDPDSTDDCYLVVQYSDGEVFSKLETGVAWDNTKYAFAK